MQPTRVSETATPDLMLGHRELREAQPEIEEADRFYRGDVGEIFASYRVKELMARIGVYDIRDLNYSRIPITALTSRLRIRSVEPVITDAEPAADGAGSEDQQIKTAKDLIARIRKRNQLDAEEKALHRNASRDGDGYMLVWPVTDDSGRTVDVDVLVHSARHVRAFYTDEDNPLQISFVIREWEYVDDSDTGDPSKPRRRANLYYPDRIERWITQAGKSGKNPEDWTRFVSDGEDGSDPQTGDIQNPYGMPWFHFRNDRPYGEPEHKGAYGPQVMINKLVLAHASTVDFSSFPQRYQLMDPTADDPTRNFGDVFSPEDDGEDPEDPGSESGLDADPSAVWKLYGTKGVGEFSASQPDIYLTPADRYIQAAAELTDTPKHVFLADGAELPSGAAYREASGPFISKVEDRQHEYGAVWSDLYEYALALLGVSGINIEVKWKPAFTVTDADGWSVVGQKVANGVPPRQALVEVGYSPEQVEDWLDDESGADLSHRVALLNQIGTAVQTLGAGVALGVVSAEEVHAVISRVLQLSGTGIEDVVPTAAPKPPPAPVPVPPNGTPLAMQRATR